MRSYSRERVYLPTRYETSALWAGSVGTSTCWTNRLATFQATVLILSQKPAMRPMAAPTAAKFHSSIRGGPQGGDHVTPARHSAFRRALRGDTCGNGQVHDLRKI